ncbi:MAG: M20/M25/M40 family metallo-hydrolase, partial [Deltaproteobacteria bacterium]|nr:M20/M25/M40 family metallo-hydrolase [Deltaproteobacteria bacterium]
METSAKEKALLDRVEALQDEMFDLTARLVAEPSVLGNEAGALAVMEEAMGDMGLDLVRVAMDDPRLLAHPEYASVPGVSADGRHNLVGIRRAEETGGNSCLYNGHLDVVPAGPEDMWSTPPFDPVIRDGWMHGRGAGDMKSGVAAMATALRAVSAAGLGLRAEAMLEAVIEEENSGNGALACRVAGFDAQAVLIPEPFGPTMLTAQPGVL